MMTQRTESAQAPTIPADWPEAGFAGGSPRRTRVIAMTGGKGGVGKSCLTANLAVHYARRRGKVLVLDADLGTADLNLLFGVAPRRSLLDVLEGHPIEDVLVETCGIHLLPGLNSSFRLANLGPRERQSLLHAVDSLQHRFDTLLVDCAPGLDEGTVAFAAAAADIVLVVTPEPTSLADAYACAKALRRDHGVRRMHLLPNAVRSAAEAQELVKRFTRLVGRFLDVSITPLPAVPFDAHLSAAAVAGVPLMVRTLDSPASQALVQAARRLDSATLGEDRSGSFQLFWQRALADVRFRGLGLVQERN